MAKVDLITREIEDQYVRENMVRLTRFLNENPLVTMNSNIIDIEPESDEERPYAHLLRGVPNVIMVLNREGEGTFSFSDINRETITVTATKGLKLKLLFGRTV